MNAHRRAISAIVPFVALAATLCVTPSAHALDINDMFKVGMHTRSRVIAHTGRDGNLDNSPVVYLENRARLSLDATPFEWVRGFFQLQDVRVWGEELNTLGDYSANGLDVHQAYVDIIPVTGDVNLTFRVGRQEINWDGQRLVGAVGWTPQARSFDAVRVMFNYDQLNIDAFFAMLTDTDSIAPGPPNNTNPFRYGVVGLNTRYRLLSDGKDFADIGITALVDINAGIDMTRITVGARHNAKFGPLAYRVEGFFQGGDVAGANISAFMLAARAGVHLKDPDMKLELWADFLSGGSSLSTAARRTFDTLFATNHKFYGFSDFFINVPVHTQNKGLFDVALKTKFKVAQPLSLGLDIHHMMVANPRGGATAWGWEIDFTAVLKPYKQLTIFAGVFTMIPQTALVQRIGGSDPDIGFFGSVQVNL